MWSSRALVERTVAEDPKAWSSMDAFWRVHQGNHHFIKVHIDHDHKIVKIVFRTLVVAFHSPSLTSRSLPSVL
jgi:hypothetical protein